MKWTPSLGPVIHKLLGTDTEFVTTVGVADLQDRPGDRLPLGHL
ncbi:MAG: hypothetical protein P8R37_06065 [Opitutae bacterium]|nr:hypothetical protein [Opitutae bacterium]MDG1301137.1 hypothetical protein [Opitutae bacterium]